jgi:hypothetical protein
MRSAILLSLFCCFLTASAQSTAREFTDPVALLQAVAQNYAEDATTFRMEAITETEQNDELRHQ